MTMHIPRTDTRPQAVLPRLPHSAPEDQDGGPLFSSSCGWAPPPHGLGQRQERDAETKWQVRVGRSLDRLEAGADGERAALGARTGSFPGREAALGQRPLADSAAAAAALSPGPAAVATWAVVPGSWGRGESAALHSAQARSAAARAGFGKDSSGAQFHSSALWGAPPFPAPSFPHLSSKSWLSHRLRGPICLASRDPGQDGHDRAPHDPSDLGVSFSLSCTHLCSSHTDLQHLEHRSTWSPLQGKLFPHVHLVTPSSPSSLSSKLTSSMKPV